MDIIKYSFEGINLLYEEEVLEIQRDITDLYDCSVEYIGQYSENPKLQIILVKDNTYDKYSVWLYDKTNHNVLFNGIYDVDINVATHYFLDNVV